VNAAFLLVTTAWLGADAAPAAKAAPAPAPAPVAAGCCDDCGRQSCLDKLRSKFSRHGCGCEKSCDTCGGGLLDKFKGKFHHECGCETSHAHACKDSCDSCGGLRAWGERMKGKFHHRGCDNCGGCDGCGSAVPPPPGGRAEPIPAPKPGAPKKMPEAPKSTSTLTIEQ